MQVNIPNEFTALIVVVIVWEFAWKGVALWKAARNKDKGWFVALLLVNSLGILPLIYILVTKPSSTTPRQRN